MVSDERRLALKKYELDMEWAMLFGPPPEDERYWRVGQSRIADRWHVLSEGYAVTDGWGRYVNARLEVGDVMHLFKTAGLAEFYLKRAANVLGLRTTPHENDRDAAIDRAARQILSETKI